MLEAGQPAPTFNLPDADMDDFEFASTRGKHVVLFFYPKDGTPGCTLEATDFSDHDDHFARNNCVVVGISRDDCLTHAEFRDRHGLSMRLLSDTEADVCRLYGVWQPKQLDGMKKMGVLRSTFVIDKYGVIRHAMYGVSPKGHALEVLALVKQLEAEQPHAHRRKHRGHAELSRVGSGWKSD